MKARTFLRKSRHRSNWRACLPIAKHFCQGLQGRPHVLEAVAVEKVETAENGPVFSSPVVITLYRVDGKARVGRLRGGPARAFDVESTLSCFGDRFIYLIYGYGSRGAVAGGPRTRRGGSENPVVRTHNRKVPKGVKL